MNDESRRAWTSIQERDPDLRNPYFRVEFVEEVARLRSNVRVAVISEGGEPIAFWPYQEVGPGVVRPVGEKIGCLHGLIGSPGSLRSGRALASACGISAWAFDHQIASQEIFQPHFFEVLDAPYLDLEGGFDAYCERRRQAGHTNKAIRNTLAGRRKLERQVGDVSFRIDCREIDRLHQLIAWKQGQMRATGIGNLFERSPWIERFMENVLTRSEPSFRGVLSVLSVDGRPAAMQFGLRSDRVLHGLFLAYDRKFARYSPGRILLVEMARHAESIGIDRLELGKGDDHYKRPFMSGAARVAVGALDLRPGRAFLRSRVHRLKKRIVDSPLDKPLRSTLRSLTRFRESVPASSDKLH